MKISVRDIFDQDIESVPLKVNLKEQINTSHGDDNFENGETLIVSEPACMQASEPYFEPVTNETKEFVDSPEETLDYSLESEEGFQEEGLESEELYTDSQFKCPKCGATDISFNETTGHLRCNYCRHTFELEKPVFEEDGKVEIAIDELKGETVRKGAANIDTNADNFVTLKCASCGAEIVINTDEKLYARCHWCRNTLSINDQIPNGSVPDVVLPFTISKEEAEETIRGFVKKRRFFATPRFKKEFTTENIMGVYFPYMLVDVNSSAKFEGKGEHLAKEYTVTVGDDTEKRYDADLYYIERDFDLAIDDLTVESNSDKLDFSGEEKTNNIINTILPFDTENCVEWNANYLKGFSSEKRDVNVNDLRPWAQVQAKDVARFAANESLGYYDRGVKWLMEDFQVKGMRWMAAYLPVWLYSYQQKKRNGRNLLHYVAVNGRTNEVMGSIPVNKIKLYIISTIIELIAVVLTILLGLPFLVGIDGEGSEYAFALLLAGFVFYWASYSRYRNQNARHYHEKETRYKISNLIKKDEFIKECNGLKNKKMEGANNSEVYGSMVSTSKKFNNALDFLE